MDWLALQRSWDTQQEAYLPDREERFSALFDVVEAQCGREPRVLDLACGTGSITLRLLERFPAATSVALDIDPSLLRIAEGTFAGNGRVTVVRADLGGPGWEQAVGAPVDAVLTATALHWLPATRLRELYAEVRQILRPGGVFCNADHLADGGLPELTKRLDELRRTRREAMYARGEALSWDAWWDVARALPALSDAVAERDRFFAERRAGSDHDESSLMSHAEHLDALSAAGFAEVGLVWRGLSDAAFAAVR